LDAGRGRLIRIFLTESLVLAVLGGALSLVFARWGLAFLAAFAPADFVHYGDTRVMEELRLVRSVLAFMLLASLAKGRRATAPVWISHERKPNSHPERPYGEF
jgi:ABC-type antimicrobial peptide transport system permease subunit